MTNAPADCRPTVDQRVGRRVGGIGFFKPRPNDRNMPTQHIATLLGATCCVRFGHPVATCCDVLGVVGPNLTIFNLSQQHPTCRNTSQHGGQTNTTCCAQQCCDMLRLHVAIVWPGLYLYLFFLMYPWALTTGNVPADIVVILTKCSFPW